MWCLFKKSKCSSTRLESLGYLPQVDMVQKFWKLCEQQLNISGLVASHTPALNFINKCIEYQLSHDISRVCIFSVADDWKVKLTKYVSSDETEDEDANEEYIEDANRDAVMIAATKLVLADTVPKVCTAFSSGDRFSPYTS